LSRLAGSAFIYDCYGALAKGVAPRYHAGAISGVMAVAP
jgi:hypothetical protein